MIRTMECDVKRCEGELAIVYLTICAEGHINEYYVCEKHAIMMLTAHEKACDYVHPIIDHMAAKMNGDEPDNVRFYQGEWVAVKDNKVIGHSDSASKLYMDKQIRHLEGTNIYKVQLVDD
jgi:hypothetical protein